MNIFILDLDPVLAAQMQCNAHVVKMTLESAQMLSTVHRMLDGNLYDGTSKSGKRTIKKYNHPTLEETLYGAVHIHHPSIVWTMESSENYKWHYAHFVALAEEYKFRYGREHMSFTKLKDALAELPKNITLGKTTQFRLAMQSNPECMFPDDPVKSYQLYYQTKSDRFNMLWTNRNKPSWFTKEI